MLFQSETQLTLSKLEVSLQRLSLPLNSFALCPLTRQLLIDRNHFLFQALDVVAMLSPFAIKNAFNPQFQLSLNFCLLFLQLLL